MCLRRICPHSWVALAFLLTYLIAFVLTPFVLIGRTNLAELDLFWLRRKIALVSQEPVLFATTIAANIAYACEATQEEVTDNISYCFSNFANDCLWLKCNYGQIGSTVPPWAKSIIILMRVLKERPLIHF